MPPAAFHIRTGVVIASVLLDTRSPSPSFIDATTLSIETFMYDTKITRFVAHRSLRNTAWCQSDRIGSEAFVAEVVGPRPT